MFKYILPLLASAALCLGQSSRDYTAFTAVSTNGGTALSWAIISAEGFNDGVPAVTFVSATSDKAASKIQAYKVNQTGIEKFTNSTTRLDIAATNGFAPSGTIIIRHVLNDTYEKRTIAAGASWSTGATNIVLTAAPLQAVIPGDLIYQVTTTGAASIPCGAATVNLSGNNIITGEGGRPLLVEIDGTSAATLNAVSCVYLYRKL